MPIHKIEQTDSFIKVWRDSVCELMSDIVTDISPTGQKVLVDLYEVTLTLEWMEQ